MATRTKTSPRSDGRSVRFRRKRAVAKTVPVHAPVDQDENELKQGQERPAKDSAYLSYMRAVASAAPLLTKEEELELSARMADRAISLIRERIAVAQAILGGRATEGSLSPAEDAAKAFLDEFNPKGLEGERLTAHLLDVVFNKAPGAEVMMRYLDHDREGKAIINRFVESNLRLVISVANSFDKGRLPLEDLIQEGNLGLVEAAPRFDYRRGFRFSTFATWWIRHAIGRAIADKGRTVRLPVHLIDAMGRVNRARERLTSLLGRQPSTEELAHDQQIDVKKIDKMGQCALPPVSLDEPVYEDSPDPLLDFISETQKGEPGDWATITPGKDVSLLREALEKLLPIEYDVLRLRFGLEDDQTLTLREVAERHDLSRERIRQLQESGLDKLRRYLKPKRKAAAI